MARTATLYLFPWQAPFFQNFSYRFYTSLRELKLSNMVNQLQVACPVHTDICPAVFGP